MANRHAELLAADGHIVYGTVRRDVEISPSVKVLKLDLTNGDSIRNDSSDDY